MSDEKTFLAIRVSKALKRRATIAAAHLDISRSELVRRAIQEYLFGQSGKDQEPTSFDRQTLITERDA